jgi:general secretion pathway protein A
MYQHFYGLRELPFELTPNPRYLFLTPQHREALSALEYGLSAAKPVTVLIGEAGTGKTTLISAALQSERCGQVSCVYLNNPALTREEFIATLASQFRLSPSAAASKAVLLEELGRILRDRRVQGQITALVIDEAQSLSLDLLEEIRLLANTETATEKLLPIVLAGQPELRDRLNDPRLRQLKQRVTIRVEIRQMTVNETAAYMATRIRTAGGDAATLFSREAVLLIHELSGGLPRTVNVICDNALLTGCALGRQPVDRQMVLDVARDFDLSKPSTKAHSTPQRSADVDNDSDNPEPAKLEQDVSVRKSRHEPRTRDLLPPVISDSDSLSSSPAPALVAAGASVRERPTSAPDEREMFARPSRPGFFSFFRS